MSGFEVVGIAASIIQIADIGAKLSVKLCAFYKTVKVANKSMQDLSSDVSLTCSILKELGKTLGNDEQTKLCSKQAFSTAQDVLKECKSVFEEIESAIDKHSQENEQSRLMRQARKITIALLGSNLDVLKGNLERLKSTTLLMLHVIMYAGQLRKTNMKTTLNDQRGLIQTLLEEKITNDARFSDLSKSIQAVSMPKDDSSFQPSMNALSIDPQPTTLSKEVGEYYTLVRGLLCQINTYRNVLEHSRYLGIQNGVMNVHSAEAVLFQHIHGQATSQIFADPLFRFGDPSLYVTSPVNFCHASGKNKAARRGDTRAESSDWFKFEHKIESDKPGGCKIDGEVDHDSSRSGKPADFSALDAMAGESHPHSYKYLLSRGRMRSCSPWPVSTPLKSGASASSMLAGAAAVRCMNNQDRQTRSRSRSRSASRLRHIVPIVGAGFATAADTGLYERQKDKEHGLKRKRSKSPSDDDVVRGRSYTHTNESLSGFAVRSNLSQDKDEIDLDWSGESGPIRLASFSPRSAPDTELPGLPLCISHDETSDVTLESLVLQWTTIKREELQLERILNRYD
ncbi:hypothetical protein N7457_003433 [Penicillium paradoxum]|uniref:uncharacterized protein n=1 Tax=Penicillium paradoxum TaxID=176176 RepID=UPI002549A2A7|nr:uncharacterized protein N7457_003433 [Penicillium paradoxum]KAJ5788443.1 hypothetical protein N7457_003433 [Penicillium paradoxum]